MLDVDTFGRGTGRRRIAVTRLSLGCHQRVTPLSPSAVTRAVTPCCHPTVTLLSPCCAIWGMHIGQRQFVASAMLARPGLQRMSERFLRVICGVTTSTPSVMLLTELNLTPLKVFWWHQSLMF